MDCEYSLPSFCGDDVPATLPHLQGNDIFIADILQSAFDDGDLDEGEIVPEGFVKVSDHHIPYVRKSTAVYAIYNNREHVTTDRLRRFITSKKKAVVASEHVISGSFIKITIEMNAEICQVLGFRKMNARQTRISAREWPLRDEHGQLNADVGIFLNLFKRDVANGGIKFIRALPQPISIENFISHISAEELIEIFQLKID